MKRTGIWLLLACAGLLAAEGRKLSFDQVFAGRGEALLKPLPFISGWADGRSYWELRDGKTFRVDARSGRARLALDPAAFAAALPTGVSLLQADDHTADFRLFVFSFRDDIYLLRGETKTFTRLTDSPGTEKNPQLSPDGSRLAYTLNGNLYVCDLSGGSCRALTHDGSETVLNGSASWVYYEEILGRASRYRAFWWSPDSRKIAFMRFDQARVPVFPLFGARGDYGLLESQRYPKAGYPNPDVSLGVADAASGAVDWIPEADGGEHYLALPKWADGNRLYFQWVNRDQNWLRLFCYDLDAKQLRPVYEEKQPAWVEFGDESNYLPLGDGSLVLLSSKSGWFHLYRIAADGAETALTGGEWSVSSLELADAAHDRVWFTARRDDSTEAAGYSVSLSGRDLRRLTPARGSHRISVSPGGAWFTDLYSALGTPARLELRRGDGRLQRSLGDSRTPALAQYDLGRAELFRIPTGDGLQLPASWILPPGFDRGRRYPVVINVYGGPHAAAVSNSFGRGFGDYFLAQQGVIVMAVDHRGSGHFGKRGEVLMHRQLGRWEMNDIVEAVKYLRTLPFVDSTRIGITGGSYGGYVSALALVKESDYFRCGIADYSVIDWRLYDSVYTERFMDTPQDNPDGYKAAAVTTYIDRYRGGLRIAHGTMDDNVHMQHILQFLDKLQDAGKSVELMIYPGERHGIRGAKSGEYRRACLDFWMRHFFDRPFAP